MNVDRKRPFTRLFSSHFDAWSMTFALSITPLLAHSALTIRNLLPVFALTIGYWVAFCLNDWFDASHDAHDPIKAQRNYFVDKQNGSPYNKSFLWYTVLFCGLIIPAYLLFGWRGVALFILGTIIMWAYSAPPLRLKSRPILDLITHALFVETYPYVAMILLLDLPWLRFDSALTLILIFASFTAQLEQQTRDYDVDMLTDRNFTTTFGLPINRVLMRVGVAAVITTTLFAIISGAIPLIYLPLGVIAAPIFFQRIARTDWHPGVQRTSYLLAVVAVSYVILLITLSFYGIVSTQG